MLKKRHLLWYSVILNVSLFFVTGLPGQSLADAVVEIEVDKIFESKLGSGFWIGFRDVDGLDSLDLFIVTAYHLIADAQSVKVRIKDINEKAFRAIVHDYKSKDLDFGFLIVRIPKNSGLRLFPLRMFDLSRLNNQSKVSHFSNPWGAQTRKHLKSPLLNTSVAVGKFSFDNESISPGSSGGLIANKTGKQLLGLVLRTDGLEAWGTKIDEIANFADNYSIRRNLLLAPKYRLARETVTWSSVCVGFLITGAVLIRESNSKYQKDYLPHRYVLDPEFQRSEEALAKAKSLKRLGIASYLVAGTSLCAAIYVNLRKPKASLAKGDKVQKISLSELEVFPHIYLDPISTPEIGMTVRATF